MTVATMNGCTWAATTDVGWITLTPPTSGSGDGRVSFAVAGNTAIGAGQRTGSIIIAGRRSTITQAGATCFYSIDPESQTIGAAGGAGTPIGVSTGGCRWTATSEAPWITVMAGASGLGNGVVAFSVAANDTGGTRTGTLTIADRTATIIQPAAAVAVPRPPPTIAACPYTISPAFNGMSWIGGGGHNVSVTTAGICGWTATSNDTWITIVTGASGTGNGEVVYAVAGNTTGTTRRGTLTIAGLTVTIAQDRFGPR
jgi:hypothetical protein